MASAQSESHIGYLHLCGTLLSHELTEAKVKTVEGLDTNSKRELFAQMRSLNQKFDAATLVPQWGLTIGEIASLLQLIEKTAKGKGWSANKRKKNGEEGESIPVSQLSNPQQEIREF